MDSLLSLLRKAEIRLGCSMAVRNHYKQCIANGGTWNHPMVRPDILRPQMPRYLNPDGTPNKLPEPITARGRRRKENWAKPKAPAELLVGLAKRPHGTKGGTMVRGMHQTNGCRFVGIRHGRRIYKREDK